MASRTPAAVLAAVLTAALAAAGAPSAAVAGGDGPIQDNSFLIEEAYNQEPGVIQHISNFQRSLMTRAWGFTFTEEWPVGGQTHQASVTFAMGRTPTDAATGMGDLALNYRWQAIGDGESPLAFAPRLSVLLPTGDAARGLGAGGAGVQVNLPFSVVLAKPVVTHLNVGGTLIPSAWAGPAESAPLRTLSVGQSLVWLAHARLNFLAEVLYTRSELLARGGAQTTESLTLNPGLRAAFNFANGLQVVPGVSVPIGIGPSSGEKGLFVYLSFEHPFRLAGKQQASVPEERPNETVAAEPRDSKRDG